jgi:hypothetical protein
MLVATGGAAGALMGGTAANPGDAAKGDAAEKKSLEISSRTRHNPALAAASRGPINTTLATPAVSQVATPQELAEETRMELAARASAGLSPDEPWTPAARARYRAAQGGPTAAPARGARGNAARGAGQQEGQKSAGVSRELVSRLIAAGAHSEEGGVVFANNFEPSQAEVDAVGDELDRRGARGTRGSSGRRGGADAGTASAGVANALDLLRRGASVFNLPAADAGSSPTGTASAGSAREVNVPLQQESARRDGDGSLLIKVFGELRVPASPLEAALARAI